MWVFAPHVAHHAKAGQFLIVRVNESGERIPLTISAVDGDTVRIIFMAVGKTTEMLASLQEGDTIRDIAGPLGRPSEISKYGTCVVIGGGVGIASAPIIAKAAKSAGNYVIGIIGARNAGLLILEDEMRACCDELFITTDDGSKGTHGFAADVLKAELAKRRDRLCMDYRSGNHDEGYIGNHPACQGENIRIIESDYGGRDWYVRVMSRPGGWENPVCLRGRA